LVEPAPIPDYCKSGPNAAAELGEAHPGAPVPRWRIVGQAKAAPR
jgi:hypothetical protein